MASEMTSEREAFEKWAGDYGFTKFDKTTTGAYKTFVSRALFDAFLAGRAHLSQPAQAVDVGAPVAWAWQCEGMKGWALGSVKPTPENTHKFHERNTVVRGLYFADTRAIGNAQADGWLPIETAPKDGTPIFIPYCGRPVPAAWNDRDEEWRWTFLSRGRDNAHREAAVKLWHPMPLPASPAPDKEGA